MSLIDSIKELRAASKADLDALLETATTEKRGLNDDEKATYDTTLEEIRSFDTRIEELVEFQVREAAAAKPGNVEIGDTIRWSLCRSSTSRTRSTGVTPVHLTRRSSVTSQRTSSVGSNWPAPVRGLSMRFGGALPRRRRPAWET